MMLDRVVEMSAIEAPESYGVEEFKDLLDKSSGYSELRSNHEKFVENGKMTLVARNVAHNLRDSLFESHKDENGKVDYEAVGQELALYRESLIARDKDRSIRMLEKYEIRDMRKILGSVQASARYYANAERLSEYEQEHGDVFVLRNELKGAALTVKKVSLMERAEKEWVKQTEESIEINLLAKCEELKREIIDDLGGEVPLTKVDEMARGMARKSAVNWRRKVVGYGMTAAFVVTSFVAGVSSWWNNQKFVQDFSVSRAPVATAMTSESSDDVIKSVQRKGDTISLDKPVDVQEPEVEEEIVTPKIEPAKPVELRGPEIVESSLEFDDVTRLENLQKEVMEKYGNGVFLYPVSKDQRLPDDYPKERSEFVLVSVDSEANEKAVEGGGSLQVAEVIKEPLKEMFIAAKKDGQEPYLRSGFRSIGTQDVLFENNVQREMLTSGIGHEEAAELVNRSSSHGGYSEHNTGLAVDVMDKKLPGFASGDQEGWNVARQNHDKGLYGWLEGNAHKYGFVISYPMGGENIYDAKEGSGYPSAEPWHLRYVGSEMATYLYDQNYLDPNNSLALDSLLRDFSKNNVDPNLIAMVGN